MKKIVLTGAAGRLGGYLREPLSRMADTLISTDMTATPATLNPGETWVQADLADPAPFMEMIAGADMVVHFGALVDEAPFEQILGPNIIGSYNVWNAAHKHGVRRVVYSSSIHAVGMYPKNQAIDTTVPHRPDGFYGLAKCFTEDLASMYWDKCGIEAVCLRILSSAEVTNARALGSWLSYADMIHLVETAITTPVTGFSIIYGVSNNDRCPVDNSKSAFLGFRPKDNAEVYAEKILAQATRADPSDPGQMCHGGPFAKVALGSSGIAHLNLKNESK